jgi:hypothetical protein
MPLFLLSLLACPPATPPDDAEEELTRTGGCGDVVFFAASDDDELMLYFEDDSGLVQAAFDAQEEQTTTYDLAADTGFTFELRSGHKLSDATCDDVVENGGPVVGAAWPAESGTVEVVITPDAEDVWSSHGHFTLTNGSFDGTVIDTLEIDTGVGWLAG